MATENPSKVWHVKIFLASKLCHERLMDDQQLERLQNNLAYSAKFFALEGAPIHSPGQSYPAAAGEEIKLNGNHISQYSWMETQISE